MPRPTNLFFKSDALRFSTKLNATPDLKTVALFRKNIPGLVAVIADKNFVCQILLSQVTVTWRKSEHERWTRRSSCSCFYQLLVLTAIFNILPSVKNRMEHLWGLLGKNTWNFIFFITIFSVIDRQDSSSSIWLAPCAAACKKKRATAM